MIAKILYSALSGGDAHPFDALVKIVVTARLPEDLKEKDSMLVVWGGSDIGTWTYKHPQSKSTYPYPTRDHAEWDLMQRAKEMGIPIIGICRGAQMLCALAGGYLIQDVRGHGGRHTVNTVNGRSFSTNSIHHQMMAGLEKTNHELLAWLPNNLSSHYIYKDDQVWTPPSPDWHEPEYVYFKDVKGFAIQWHPEMMDGRTEATQYVFETMKERLCQTAKQ
jgi:putative glutamine amidotransferase